MATGNTESDKLLDFLNKNEFQDVYTSPFFFDVKINNFSDENFFGFRTKIISKIKDLPKDIVELLEESKFAKECICQYGKDMEYNITIDFYANNKKEFSMFRAISGNKLIQSIIENENSMRLKILDK
jgi:hypothetical protein